MKNIERRCIFTGLKSEITLKLTKDNYSWTKSVPVSKTYLLCRELPEYRDILLPNEEKVIRYFFECEINNAFRKGEYYFDTEFFKTNKEIVRTLLDEKVNEYQQMRIKKFELVLNKTQQDRINSLLEDI